MNKISDINKAAVENDNFRHVLLTGKHTQVVVMSIPPGGEIGEEVHPDNDQVLYLVEGAGKVFLEGVEDSFAAGDLVLVPAGTKHNFVSNPESMMKIITTYSPPHHPDGLIHKTKADADREGN